MEILLRLKDLHPSIWISSDDPATEMYVNKKYPLRRYIIDVLTHTTAWDQHWGGDEALKQILINLAKLPLV